MSRLATAILAVTALVAVVALYRTGRLKTRLRRLERTMAKNIDDVNAALDQRDQAQTEAINRVAEDVAELRRRLDAGLDLTPIVERLEAGTAQLQAVDPDPSFPAPVDPEQPTA